MVIDDKTDSTSAIDEPIEKSDRIDDEIASVPTAEVKASDEDEKVTKEVPLVAMVRSVFTSNDLSVICLFRNKKQHRNRRNQPHVLHEEQQIRRNQRSVSHVLLVQILAMDSFSL